MKKRFNTNMKEKQEEKYGSNSKQYEEFVRRQT